VTEELRSKYTRMSDATQPLISLPALERALSPERLAAYRQGTDRDETDGVARYLWNLALANALQPALHALEITFRNEIARAAAKLTQGRQYTVARVPSWLDADPTMLLEHEAEKVERAKKDLSMNPMSQTEGHLIAKLDFGFWVALCRDAYSDVRGEGPRLWPRALDLAFRKRPKSVTTRAEIFHRFDHIRKYRNRVAHHEPIWDRGYLEEHDYILESLSWMHPKLADAVREMSPAIPTFEAGASAYRPHAETLLGTGPGLAAILEAQLGTLVPERRALVASLVEFLAARPEDDPRNVIADWANSFTAGA
jgi:hypothetical protein